MDTEVLMQFIILQQKKISKGEKAGQTFYVARFFGDIDTMEFTIFDNTTLINKLLALKKMDTCTCTLSISQFDGKWKVELKDVNT